MLEPSETPEKTPRRRDMVVVTSKGISEFQGPFEHRFPDADRWELGVSKTLYVKRGRKVVATFADHMWLLVTLEVSE